MPTDGFLGADRGQHAFAYAADGGEALHGQVQRGIDHVDYVVPPLLLLHLHGTYGQQCVLG
jgi:hypothetical protein